VLLELKKDPKLESKVHAVANEGQDRMVPRVLRYAVSRPFFERDLGTWCDSSHAVDSSSIPLRTMLLPVG